MEGENWSAEHVPTSEDVACVPLATVVTIESGAATASVLQGEGEVKVESGSLSISGAEMSNIGTLRMEGGELKGGGTLFVTRSLISAGADMRGTGTTIVGSFAAATIAEPEEKERAGLLLLGKHTLQNNGELSVNGPATTLAVLEGSTLENNGELDIAGAESALRELEAHIFNAGELTASGTEAELRAEAGTIESEGLFDFASAESRFVATEGVDVEIPGFLASFGEVSIEEAALTISGVAESSNIGALRLDSAELKGAGTLYVTSSLVTVGADMRGTGTTIVGIGATAVVTEPEEGAALRLLGKHTLRNSGEVSIHGPAATLAVLEGSTLENDERLEILGAESTLREQEAHIVNAGHLFAEGADAELRAEAGTIENEGQLEFLPALSRITGAEGASLENSGELVVDGEGEAAGLVAGSGESPSLTNLGLLSKGPGEYASVVGFPIDNLGQVKAQGGEFFFAAGGISEAGEKSWGGSFEEGEIVFWKGVFDLGGTVNLFGEIRVLSTATVEAGEFTATGSWIHDEEGALELTGTEAATKFGRLDLIGADLEVPEGGTAGAQFLGLAEANLAVAPKAHWGKGYVEQVAGNIEVASGSVFEASYIKQLAGETLVEPEATFSVNYVEKHGGSVHIGTNATFGVSSGWEQLAGTLTVGAGTTWIGEPSYWKLGEGSQTFGEGVEANIHFFEQDSGELSVAQTGHFHVDTWDHIGGSTSIAPVTTVVTRVLEQHADSFEIGNGSTVGEPAFLGVYGGELAIGSGTAVSGSTVAVFGGQFDLEGSSTLSLSSDLGIYGGEFSGTGDTESRTFSVSSGEMNGAGTSTVSEGTWVESGSEEPVLNRRTLITAGEVHLESGALAMGNGATWITNGEFEANSEAEAPGGQIHPVEGTTPAPLMVNNGSLEKVKGPGTTTIDVPFEELGQLGEREGHLVITHPIGVSASELFGTHCNCGHPIDTATGNYFEHQTDFEIPGRGAPLALTRSYSAQAAAVATSPGPFGYGWTIGFGDKLLLSESGKATALLGSGATIPFTKAGPGTFTSPAWSKDTLNGTTETGFVLGLPGGAHESFAGSGALQSMVDSNGNETSLEYSEAGRLRRIVDSSGRAITLTYNEGGLVETAEDPMGHKVTYTYEGGELHTVTLPGEEAPRWTFLYDGAHRMTKEIDGRGGETTNEYNGANQVIAQTDPTGRVLAMAYQSFRTTVTNESTGAVTEQVFTSNNEPSSITSGAGTAVATTERFAYNKAGETVSKTDGNGHTTTYGYDPADDRTSETDPLGDETSWTYNEVHEVLSETKPNGEKTTIVRDGAGNPETISRPAPGEESQVVSFEYGPHGEVKDKTDALGRTWTYGYDGYGDQTSESDPEGDERTWKYDEDSRLESSVSPRGNEPGAKVAEFTTTIERDPQGQPIKVVSPAEGTTEYHYDADGDLETTTDPNGHETKFTYDPDGQQTKVQRPNGDVEETGYDGAGQIISQTDGNKGKTTYVRNVLEQPVEVIDPLERVTTRAFDAAGNLKTKVDPQGRTTYYGYDKANRMEEVAYSDGVTPDVTFGHDEDGDLTSMVDGTGESTFEYDQLGRLIHGQNGNGETASWEYNLDDEPIGLTYPNGKSIGRAYDKSGRLESLTDWLGHTTSFAYNADSALTATTFPTMTGDLDEYGYDDADRMTGVTMKQGPETLASIGYTRDPAGQVESLISQGLPGAEEEAFGYDENERLVEAGEASYEYDAANNLTKAPGTTNGYDKASQLESATGATFSYDEEGERTAETPSSGPATTYGYDQAGNLTSVERPEEGESPAVAESFTYDGNGMMASQIVGPTTKHLFWDPTESPSPLLSDGEDSYLYGPGGLPIEQISTEEVPTYLHHDQLGSTRLLTDGKGEVAGTSTYSAYGTLEGHTGTATTALGYAGQYTLGQSGLQYLRARFYDPASGQFLTRDPLEATTREPYAYAGNDPMDQFDPSGEDFFGDVAGAIEGAAGAVEGAAGAADGGCAVTWEIPGVDIATCGTAAAATAAAATVAVVAAVSDEGEDERADTSGCPLERDATPGGIPYSDHYLEDGAGDRNIPGSVVDEAIEHGDLVADEGDRQVYYDPNNDTTVVVDEGEVLSARRGLPRSNQR